MGWFIVTLPEMYVHLQPMGFPGLTGELLFPSCERFRDQEGCICSHGLFLVGIEGIIKRFQAVSGSVKVKMFF